MRVVDVNLLLYAYDKRAELHPRAKAWVEARFNDREQTGLSHATLVAFVRITTSARIVSHPFEIDEACRIVDEWLIQPSVVLLDPTERHWRIFADAAIEARARGPLVPDADLAATATEHGAVLCTHDRDFARFPNLRVEYPLS